jgi:protein phosphatase PTC7
LVVVDSWPHSEWRLAAAALHRKICRCFLYTLTSKFTFTCNARRPYSQEDIAAAEKLSAKLQQEAEQVRKRAAGEEAKTLRSVNLRQQMDSALKEKVAEIEAKETRAAAAPPEFAEADLAQMDAATVRRLLDERGLATSGKLDRLRARLGEVRQR